MKYLSPPILPGDQGQTPGLGSRLPAGRGEWQSQTHHHMLKLIMSGALSPLLGNLQLNFILHSVHSLSEPFQGPQGPLITLEVPPSCQKYWKALTSHMKCNLYLNYIQVAVDWMIFCSVLIHFNIHTIPYCNFLFHFETNNLSPGFNHSPLALKLCV